MRLSLGSVWVGAWGFVAACGSTQGPTTQAAQGMDASNAESTLDSAASTPENGSGSSGGAGSSGGNQSPGDGGSTVSPSDALGHPDDGGAGAHDAGSGTTNGDAGMRQCKRGVAANAAPGSAFSPSQSQPGVSWWYNWATQGSGQGSGIEFVPMIWGSGSLHSALPAGSKFVLGFNEPNFKSQSNLTPAQAAADWPSVETAASAPVA